MNAAPAAGSGHPVATKVLVAIIGTLLVIFGLGYWIVTQWQPEERQFNRVAPEDFTVTYSDIRDNLAKDNPAFSAGYAALREGRYEDAIAQFTIALETVTDPQLRVAVQSMLAVANMRAQHQIEAIKVLQEIAATDIPQTSRARAFAIQQMGHLFYTYGSRADIREALFGEAPYAALYVEDNAAQTLVNIFEYSIQYYDLAASLYELVDLNAGMLVAAGKTVGSEATMNKIQDYLVRAEPDVAYMRSHPTLYLQLQEALALKAYGLGKLAEAGYVGESDAFQAFDDSLEAYQGAPGGAGGSVRYYYAAQLARMHGEAQKDKIISVLSPLYTSEIYRGAQIEHTLRRKDFANRWQDHNLKLLIDIDPQFKAYLSSIGWTTADFETIAQY